MNEVRAIALHEITRSESESPSFTSVMVSSLDRRWEKYLRELRRCRKKCSEKAVHDLRVATRRLISTLTIVSTAVTDDHLEKVSQTIRKRLKEFGPLRDIQIQLARLEKMRDEFPEVEAFYTLLLLRERRVLKTLEKQINKERIISLGREIAEIRNRIQREFGGTGMDDIGFTAAKGATAAAFMRTAGLLREIDPAESKTIHRVRISFKKFRYMAESLQPLLPDISDGMLKAMNKYQVRMGLIQDNEVLTSSFRSYIATVKRGPRLNYLPFLQKLQQEHRELAKTFLENKEELYGFWESKVSRHVTRKKWKRSAGMI